MGLFSNFKFKLAEFRSGFWTLVGGLSTVLFSDLTHLSLTNIFFIGLVNNSFEIVLANELSRLLDASFGGFFPGLSFTGGFIVLLCFSERAFSSCKFSDELFSGISVFTVLLRVIAVANFRFNFELTVLVRLTSLALLNVTEDALPGVDEESGRFSILSLVNK